MTRFLFVRHAAHDLLSRGVVAGRQPGVHLNGFGKKQAERSADRLSILPIEAIYCSPLERACETATPLASRLGLPLQIAEEFNEIDFGEWTNCAFVELNDLPEWRRWNQFRSAALTPSGDSMLAVQARALTKMLELHRWHTFVAVFTHGDVIRAVLAHFLGVPLDLFQRIQIDCCSASLVELDEHSVRLRLVNGNAASAELLAEQKQQ
jgi:broad specificity phosphatase PhoE